MRIIGNRFAASFEYKPLYPATKVTYGKNTLLSVQDAESSNYIELGYNSIKSDPSTRLLFSAETAEHELPNITTNYFPGLYSEDFSTQDDVPLLSGVANVSWVDVQNVGRVYKGTGYDSGIYLGPYNKSLWIGDSDSFLVEAYLAPSVSFNIPWCVIDIGFDSTNFTGFKLEKNTLLGFTFSWGDGSAIHTISDPLLLATYTGYIHLAVIKTADKVAMYVNGNEIASQTSPGDIDQSLLYAGSKNPVLFKNIDGSVLFTRVAVGEFSPADFSYFLYTVDGNGNHQSSPYIFDDRKAYSIYFDYQHGGNCKNIDIFNPNATGLKNYVVPVDPGLTKDHTVFEDMSGASLPSFYFYDKYYVKVPFLPSSGIVQIRAIDIGVSGVVPQYPQSTCKFYDNYADVNRLLESNVWTVTTESPAAVTNVSYLTDNISGIAISYQAAAASDATQSYMISNNDSAVYSSYRWLFSQRFNIYKDATYSGIAGVTIFPDQPVPNYCVNLVTCCAGGSINRGGAYVGGDAANYEEFINWSSSNLGIVNSGLDMHFYELVADDDAQVSVTNLTRNNSISFDAGSVTPGWQYTNRVGFFIAHPIALSETSQFNFGPCYVIPYVTNEPIVTVSDIPYQLESKTQVYVNGVKQF